jgi:hypothetical protein
MSPTQRPSTIADLQRAVTPAPATTELAPWRYLSARSRLPRALPEIEGCPPGQAPSRDSPATSHHTPGHAMPK